MSTTIEALHVALDPSLEGTDICGRLEQTRSGYEEHALTNDELADYIPHYTETQLPLPHSERSPLMVRGFPGIGKTLGIREAVLKLDGVYWDKLRVTSQTPADIAFPVPNHDARRVDWFPSGAYPHEAPKHADGTPARFGVIVLEELPNADPDVLAALYQLLEDGKVGPYPLDNRWIIIATGNYADGASKARELPLPIRSRIHTVHLTADVESFLSWGIREGVDVRVLAFLRRYPELLSVYNPKTADHAYPCPRSWTRGVSRYLQSGHNAPALRRKLISGMVGLYAGALFSGFLSLMDQLPELVELENDPEHAPLPSDESLAWALLSEILQNGCNRNWGALLTYLKRWGAEYGAFACAYLDRKGSELSQHPATVEFRNYVTNI